MELAWAYADGTLPDNQPLIDYVLFSQACQQSPGDFDRASFYINGAQRPWTNQTDGPALQTVALLAMYRQLDEPTRRSRAADRREPGLPQSAYQGQTYNLWEEEYGYSFFARSAQLRCFQAIAANTIGITVPAWLPDALSWLITALDPTGTARSTSRCCRSRRTTAPPTTRTSTSSRPRSTAPSR